MQRACGRRARARARPSPCAWPALDHRACARTRPLIEALHTTSLPSQWLLDELLPDSTPVAPSYYGEVPTTFWPVTELYKDPQTHAFVLADDALASSSHTAAAEAAAPEFEPASAFNGKRQGYVFRSDHYGLGYYRDVRRPAPRRVRARPRHAMLSCASPAVHAAPLIPPRPSGGSWPRQRRSFLSLERTSYLPGGPAQRNYRRVDRSGEGEEEVPSAQALGPGTRHVAEIRPRSVPQMRRRLSPRSRRDLGSRLTRCDLDGVHVASLSQAMPRFDAIAT